MLGFSYQVVQEKNSKVWPKDYFSNIKKHIIGIFWYYEKKNSYCFLIHTLAYTPWLQGINVPCQVPTYSTYDDGAESLPVLAWYMLA